jgi:hypothetical protein
LRGIDVLVQGKVVIATACLCPMNKLQYKYSTVNLGIVRVIHWVLVR